MRLIRRAPPQTVCVAEEVTIPADKPNNTTKEIPTAQEQTEAETDVGIALETRRSNVACTGCGICRQRIRVHNWSSMVTVTVTEEFVVRPLQLVRWRITQSNCRV